MAGAAPTAKPAPFLRPLDVLDRGILLAEASLSLVVVAVMVLVAVIESTAALLHLSHPWLNSASDVLMHGTIWAALLGASYATRERRHLAIDGAGPALAGSGAARGRRGRCGDVRRRRRLFTCLAYGLYSSLLEQVASTAEQARLLHERGMGGDVDRSYEFQFIIPGAFLLIGARLLLHAFHEWLAALKGAPRDTEPPPHALDPEANRVAPVSQASLTEAGIAFATLLALLGLARGTTVLCSARARRGFDDAGHRRAVLAPQAAPPAPSHRPILSPTRYAENATPSQLGTATLGVAIVLALCWVGMGHVTALPIAWGVGLCIVMALMGAPLFSFLRELGAVSAGGAWLGTPRCA